VKDKRYAKRLGIHSNTNKTYQKKEKFKTVNFFVRLCFSSKCFEGRIIDRNDKMFISIGISPCVDNPRTFSKISKKFNDFCVNFY